MDPATFMRLRAAFEAALELPADERDAFLERELGDASALLAEARAMVTADAAEGADSTFLAPPGPHTAGAAALAAEGPPLEAGEELGDFRLVRLIGRGGMGEVWEAEQDKPRRRVALKVLQGSAEIGTGMRARERFEHEAELLARLDHHGIARVLAAGVWARDEESTPRPWFALELVDGARPLTDFARGLPLAERLRLFVEVCNAVHHGHLRGVVHRDLKPANILVGRDGRLRVIDFGIAHAIGDPTDGNARHTMAGELAGTLGYMAPEQVEGREARVDARADVFALGVLLFELLVGETPWHAEASSWAALAREVTERDPAPPSSKVPGLSCELDWIFARATEKDPARRYASAHELGAELTRFATHEPLVAGPPSTMYRARKFARRNRTLVGGVVLALVLTTLGAAGTTWGWLRSLDREEQRREAQARADERATRAWALNAFLDRMLRAANPLTFQGSFPGDTRLADVLLEAAAEVEGAFPDDPALEAETRQLIGAALHGQGHYAAAIEQLTRAIELYAALGGDHAAERLRTRRYLGAARVRSGDVEAGLAELEAAWDEAQASPSTEQGRIRSDLAWALLQVGRADEALDHARAARDLLDAEGPTGADVATGAATCIAQALRLAGHPEGVAVTEAAYHDAHRRAELRAGADSVQAGITANNLATFLHGQGRTEEAAVWFEKAVQLQERGLRADNPALTIPLYNLSALQLELGHLDDALSTIETCLAIAERSLGTEHPSTIEALHARADVLWWLERYDEARVDFARCAAALASDEDQHDMAVMMELRVLEMRVFGSDAEDALFATSELAARITRLTAEEPPESSLHDFAARTRSRVEGYRRD